MLLILVSLCGLISCVSQHKYLLVHLSCHSITKTKQGPFSITEKEAVDLAVLELAKPIKDLAFQLEFTSLAHLVQKLTAYELYHPELYQDKFKRHVNVAPADESDDSGEEQEVAVAEWTRGANPIPCKWTKQQRLVKGFDFDVTKAEQIF